MIDVQKVGLKRNPIDKYYTSLVVANDCIDLFISKVDVCIEDLIVEPSAGNGSFIGPLNEVGCAVAFYDIAPEHSCVSKQDYLDPAFDVAKINAGGHPRVFVVGNPPFGRQSSLAIKFIKKSCEYCDAMGFILPKSFKKESMKRHVSLKYHLVLERNIDGDAFMVDGKPHNVPCVFQIWEKLGYDRPSIVKLKPCGYSFVKMGDIRSPHISFIRVGVNAGRVSREIIGKNEQTHYFIRFDNGCDNIMYEKLCNLTFGCRDDTVGPRSISKQELICEVNSIFCV